MLLCTVELYCNFLHFKTGGQLRWRTPKALCSQTFKICTHLLQFWLSLPSKLLQPPSVTVGPYGGFGGVSVTLLRELDWKKFPRSTFPIHPRSSELHLFTDLLSLEQSGPRRLPDAPIAALLRLCHYKGKPALYNRGHERYHAVVMIAAQSFIFQYYEGQMRIIEQITLGAEAGNVDLANLTYLGIFCGIYYQGKNVPNISSNSSQREFQWHDLLHRLGVEGRGNPFHPINRTYRGNYALVLWITTLEFF